MTGSHGPSSPIDFRFRFWIILALYLLGFFAPWQRYFAQFRGPRLWSWLALELFSTNRVTSQQAFVLVLAAAIALAIAGAVLRVWGTAYLGSETVTAGAMRAAEVVADGPYRFLRNPLYVGMWLTGAAVSILMPWTGGLFFIVALAAFSLRLIAVEERYLTAQRGEAYRAYRANVGRPLPKFTSPLPASGVKPQWLRSLAGESYPVGIAVCLAALGWNYDASLLTRCVMICFGASLVMRAVVQPQQNVGRGVELPASQKN